MKPKSEYQKKLEAMAKKEKRKINYEKYLKNGKNSTKPKS